MRMTPEEYEERQAVANARKARRNTLVCAEQVEPALLAPECDRAGVVLAVADDRTIDLALPWPPSTNSDKFGNHVLKPETRTFREAVAYLFKRMGCLGIDGPFFIQIRAYPPDNRGRDIDNIVKPTLDALQRAGAVTNDKYCKRLEVHWLGKTPQGSVSVTIGGM